jgi:hypothetical protein
MIRKTGKKRNSDKFSEIKLNLQCWLSRPHEERLAAVDDLRREYYGAPTSKSGLSYQPGGFHCQQEGNRQKKDVADIEALGE